MDFTDLTNNAFEALRGAGNYVTSVTTPTIRLGVTGLARSGKTVFITALVRNLIEGGRLPFFTPFAQGRVRNVYLQPQPDDDVPRFAYEDHLAALSAAPPHWPRSTNRVSQLRVTIEYESQNSLRRAWGPSLLHVDIVDYPGEWLIDLPLLDQSFAKWSQNALALARHPSRRAHAKPFLDFLHDLPAMALREPGDHNAAEQLARRGAALFTAYLAEARADDHALSIAGPGRFLMPGDLQGSPLLTFFPMDPMDPMDPVDPLDSVGVDKPNGPPADDKANTPADVPVGAMKDITIDDSSLHRPDAQSHADRRDELHTLLGRRYQSYKAHVVKPFFSRHFVKLDRQIVLVDALAALNAGPHALRDLQASLEDILNCFRPGASTWLSSLLFRRIDRLAFAATKADHLHHTAHNQLEAILRALTDQAMRRATSLGAQISVIALAALRSTREVEIRQGKDLLQAIKGTPLPGERLGDVTFDGTQEVAIFPGDLPVDPQVAINQGRETVDDAMMQMRFIRFRPPQLKPHHEYGRQPAAPHIRLDRALEFLLGDKLQ